MRVAPDRVACVALLAATWGEAARAAPAAAPAVPAWTDAFDFDGDGALDHVDVAFSGGAHCCYTLAIRTARGARIGLPFELDGGYVQGLDLSQPERLTVEVDRGGRARLVLVFGTYGADVAPISRALRRRWGVRSHRVRVTIHRRRFTIENL